MPLSQATKPGHGCFPGFHSPSPKGRGGLVGSRQREAVSFAAAGTPGFGFYCTSRPCNSKLAENDTQRAEACERGLHQIEADKGREPEPILAVALSQQEAGEDEATSNAANDHFEFHNKRFGCAG